MSIGSAADKALAYVGAPVAASYPWWQEYVNGATALIGLATIAIIGFCRCYIAIRDVIDRRNGKRD
jgi:hypothetical protein